MIVPMLPRTFSFQEASIVPISDGVIATNGSTFLPCFLPGEPISFTWRFWDSWGNAGLESVNNASIVGTVLLINRLTSVYKSNNTKYVKGGVSETITNLPIAAPSFYKIGNQQLILQVAIGAEIVENTCDLAITPEAINDWLAWLPLASTQHLAGSRTSTALESWKENYTIRAVFTNKSRFSRMQGTAQLFENEMGSSNRKFRGSQAISVNSLGQIELVFIDIKQDWQWLIPKIWVPSGDNFKMFQYHAVLTLNDDFNNSYSRIEFGPFLVNVRVSDKKQALGYSATAAMAIALVLYAVSFLITQAPGHTAQGVADGLGAAALDPPSPDPQFRKPVKIRYRKILAAFKNKKGFEAFGGFFNCASRIAVSSVTLSKIEGRIIGATIAKKSKSLTMQQKSYENILQSMMVDAFELTRHFDKAIEELGRIEETVWDNSYSIIDNWVKSGFNSRFRSEALKLHVPKSSIEAMREALKYPHFVAQVKKGITLNLTQMHEYLTKYAASSLEYKSTFMKVIDFTKRKAKH